MTDVPNPPNPKQRYGDMKVPLAYVPPASIIYEAAAFQEGAEKYGPYNWRDKAVEAMTYISASLRHIAAYQDGEYIDAESGKPHLGLAKACLGILIDATEQGNLVDNRPLAGTAALLLASMRKVPAPEPLEPIDLKGLVDPFEPTGCADDCTHPSHRHQDCQDEGVWKAKTPCLCPPGSCHVELGGAVKYVYCKKAEEVAADPYAKGYCSTVA